MGDGAFVRRLRGIYDRLRRALDARQNGERLYHFNDAKASLTAIHLQLAQLTRVEVRTAEDVSAHFDSAHDHLQRSYDDYDEAKKDELLRLAMSDLSSAARVLLAAGCGKQEDWDQHRPTPSRPPDAAAPSNRRRFAVEFPQELRVLADRWELESKEPPQPRRARKPASAVVTHERDSGSTRQGSRGEPRRDPLPPPNPGGYAVQRAAALIAEFAVMRFVREQPRPPISTVATSLVVAAGIAASASNAPFTSSIGRVQTAFARGMLSDEKSDVTPNSGSNPRAQSFVVRLRCLEHEMALQILRGIAETPDLVDLAFLAAALDEAAGTLAKCEGVDLPTVLAFYNGGIDLFRKHRTDSLKHWTFDGITVARIAALLSKLLHDDPPSFEPPSPCPAPSPSAAPAHQ